MGHRGPTWIFQLEMKEIQRWVTWFQKILWVSKISLAEIGNWWIKQQFPDMPQRGKNSLSNTQDAHSNEGKWVGFSKLLRIWSWPQHLGRIIGVPSLSLWGMDGNFLGARLGVKLRQQDGPQKRVLNGGYVVTPRNGWRYMFFFCSFFLPLLSGVMGTWFVFSFGSCVVVFYLLPKMTLLTTLTHPLPLVTFWVDDFSLGYGRTVPWEEFFGGPLISGFGSSGHSPVWGDVYDVWKFARPR